MTVEFDDKKLVVREETLQSGFVDYIIQVASSLDEILILSSPMTFEDWCKLMQSDIPNVDYSYQYDNHCGITSYKMVGEQYRISVRWLGSGDGWKFDNFEEFAEAAKAKSSKWFLD